MSDFMNGIAEIKLPNTPHLVKPESIQVETGSRKVHICRNCGESHNHNRWMACPWCCPICGMRC